MPSIIQLLFRSASFQSIKIVERVFADAGLETRRFDLGASDNAIDDVLAQIADEDAHPIQVWIVPAMTADLMCIDQDRVASARKLIGLSPRESYARRLLITLEPATEAPEGCTIVAFDDLQSGKIGEEALRAIFDQPEGSS